MPGGKSHRTIDLPKDQVGCCHPAQGGGQHWLGQLMEGVAGAGRFLGRVGVLGVSETRQTGRQINRQADRQTDKQADMIAGW